MNAQEEDHFRMDIPSSENLRTKGAITKAVKMRSPLRSSLQFALSALLIYAALFAFTNAGAYSKIFMANVQEFFVEDGAVTAETAELAATEAQPKVPVQPSQEELAALDIPETVTPENLDGILPLAIRPTTYENRISIPAINIDSRIVEPTLGVEALLSSDWNELEDQIRSSLLQGIVHYPGTADPGEEGNAFLTGHSSNVFWEPSPYNTVFALLPRIAEGDEIYITYDQTEFHYIVTQTKEVSPKDVSILEQTEGPTLTLMTCTPVGTTLKRFVVTAELVE